MKRLLYCAFLIILILSSCKEKNLDIMEAFCASMCGSSLDYIYPLEEKAYYTYQADRITELTDEDLCRMAIVEYYVYDKIIHEDQDLSKIENHEYRFIKIFEYLLDYNFAETKKTINKLANSSEAFDYIFNCYTTINSLQNKRAEISNINSYDENP